MQHQQNLVNRTGIYDVGHCLSVTTWMTTFRGTIYNDLVLLQTGVGFTTFNLNYIYLTTVITNTLFLNSRK